MEEGVCLDLIPGLVLLLEKGLPLYYGSKSYRIVQNNLIYVGKTNELKELCRPFVGVKVSLFWCRQLCWILEVEQNTVRLV
jgi:hypothetical protein